MVLTQSLQFSIASFFFFFVFKIDDKKNLQAVNLLQ